MALTPRKQRSIEKRRIEDNRSRAASSTRSSPARSTSRGHADFPSTSAASIIRSPISVASTPKTSRRSAPVFTFDEQTEQETEPTSSRGRPKRRRGTSRENAGRPSSSMENCPVVTPFLTPRPERDRQVKLKQKHRDQIDANMRNLANSFNERPYPTLPSQPARSSGGRNYRNFKCSDACDCSSMAQCQQNALAFQAAAKYMNGREPDIIKPPTMRASPTSRCHPEMKNGEVQHSKCAAVGAGHRADYYDSGQFGDALCDHCGARLLLSEDMQIRRGKKSACCHNGEVHTQQMQQELAELQHPPEQLKKRLVENTDRDVRNQFLDNAMTFNNTFAFASVSSNHASREECHGREDWCKYNGEFSFQFYDLVAPTGKRPLFAQVYTLSPEEALQVRPKNVPADIGKAIKAAIKHVILTNLEEMMKQNPYAQAFKTVGEKVEESKERNGGNVPKFQIVLLTDRQMRMDVFEREDCTVIERADAPTAEQVAVVWVSQDGNAPEVRDFWICDKAGKKRVLKSGKPQIDPCCFPLLHPKGTPGYRWFLKKNGRGTRTQTREEQEEERMQNELDGALNEAADDLIEPEDEDMGVDEGVDDVEDEDEIESIMDEDLPNEGEEPTTQAEVEILEEENEFDQELPEMEGDDSALEPSFVDDAVLEEDHPLNHISACPKVTTRDNISERQFYRYRMAMREESRGSFHWLWFGRRLAEYFTIAILNRIERNEMDHVKKQQRRINLRQIIAKDYLEAIKKGLRRSGENRKLGWVYMTPRTWAGSRQYYQAKYADFLTIVRRVGNPTWFVTFTGNPNWPEIVAALPEGQKYEHRPDIVCRIFLDKITVFVNDLVKRQVLGNVGAWAYSVEHQKRGMPHIHMLLTLKKDSRIATPEQVDQYISARIPALPPIDDLSPAANQQRRYWHLVTSNLLHDCNEICGGDVGACKKHFPKPFSERTELSEVRYSQYIRIPPDDADQLYNPTRASPTEDVETTPIEELDEEEFLPDNDAERQWAEVRYQRVPPKQRKPARTFNVEQIQEQCGQTFEKKKGRGVAQLLDDSHVVPHNKFLLLKYGCHINVEYVFGQKANKYIFKYFLKGFEKGYVRVQQTGRGPNGEEFYDYDEMAATFKVRYMTAMEAYLRLNSYKIVNMSHQIYTLSVHDELGQTIVLEEGNEEEAEGRITKDTKLTAFFKLCDADASARELTYDRLPYKYRWDQKARSWRKRAANRKLEEDPEKAKMFVRIYTVSPKRTELYAIRILLLNRLGPRSFQNLRTVGDNEFLTFTEAAQHLGLLASDEQHVTAMQDACAEKSNLKQLQHYFAMLIYHGRPSEPQKLFEQFLDEMNPPICSNDPNHRPKTAEQRKEKVLRNLEYYFRCMGSTCTEMGLHGLPADYDHALLTEAMEAEDLWNEFYGAEKNSKKKPTQLALEQIERLNSDQKAAFQQVRNAIVGESDQRCFFIDGDGGTGKTFLYNTIIRWCLAGKPDVQDDKSEQPLIRGSVISAASTGIAALLLIGGGTVHRQFFVPNDIDDDTQSKVSFESAKGLHLRAANLIIIDEVSMLSNKILRYLDRMLRDVCDKDQPFGGKVMVLGGDWKQLAPVVEHGTREDQVGESIKLDPLFIDNFQKISLKINMRTGQSEQHLREWLNVIGNGLHQIGASRGRENMLDVPEGNVVKTIEEMIEFCFTPQLFDNPMENAKTIAENAILCPRNVDVEVINTIALERMHGKQVVYASTDEPLDANDDFTGHRADYNIEALNNEMPSGFPPHLLRLKVGAPIMLIRNLDVVHGLCNGTRMQVMKMTKEALHCRILSGPRADAKTTFIIPKAKFEYGRGKTHRGVHFCRRQFPVRLCFAMTVNKSQGQTLKKMGLLLNGKQCFSHGQAYVAMSRVTSLDGIRIFSPSTCRGNENHIDNVVYQELLDNKIVPMPQHTFVEEPITEEEPHAVDEEQVFLDPDDFIVDPLPDNFDDFFD